MSDINNKEYIICPCCNEKVPNGKFCPNCGTALVEVSDSLLTNEQIKTLDDTFIKEQTIGFFQSTNFNVLNPSETIEENHPVDDSNLTFIGEFCKKTVATVGGDGYSEIVLYENETDGTFQIHTYSKYVYMQKESHHSFKAKTGAYDELLKLVDELELDEYEGKQGVGLCGAMYICKYKKDGIVHRVTTDNLGTDGSNIIMRVGNLLENFKGEEITL